MRQVSVTLREVFEYINRTRRGSIGFVNGEVLYFNTKAFEDEFRECDFGKLRKELAGMGFTEYEPKSGKVVKSFYYYYHPNFNLKWNNSSKVSKRHQSAFPNGFRFGEAIQALPLAAGEFLRVDPEGKGVISETVLNLYKYIWNSKVESIGFMNEKILYIHALKFRNEFENVDLRKLIKEVRSLGFVEYHRSIHRGQSIPNGEYHFYHPNFDHVGSNIRRVDKENGARRFPAGIENLIGPITQMVPIFTVEMSGVPGPQLPPDGGRGGIFPVDDHVQQVNAEPFPVHETICKMLEAYNMMNSNMDQARVSFNAVETATTEFAELVSKLVTFVSETRREHMMV